MGTRGTITFVENDKKQLSLYSQYDSYIEGGLGEKIFNFIKNHKIVNGISLGEKEEVSNGFDDFILQFIRDLKNESKVGTYYLYQDLELDDLDNKNKDILQEYNYVVMFEKNREKNITDIDYTIRVDCLDYNGKMIYRRIYKNQILTDTEDLRKD